MALLGFSKKWWRVAGVLALPSCVVSFKDYPVGALGSEKSEGGANASGTSTGGDSLKAGSDSGGTVTVMGGTSAGNTMSGTGGASGGVGATGGTGATAGNAGTEMGGTSAGTGGVPMEGGAPSDGGAPGEIDSPIIDDFEDGDGLILAVSGRRGTWYASNDGTDTQTPKPGQGLVPTTLSPARGNSTRGARTSGGAFDNWGALIGAPLLEKSGVAYPYDLSGYQGIRFWVKSGTNVWNSAKKMRLALPMTGTVAGTGCTMCNDHFAAEFNLSTTWTQVSVPFTALKQAGTGKPQLGAPDLKHVIFLEFGVGAHVSFDVYIDDVELY